MMAKLLVSSELVSRAMFSDCDIQPPTIYNAEWDAANKALILYIGGDDIPDIDGQIIAEFTKRTPMTVCFRKSEP